METLEYAAKVAENVYVLEVRCVRVLEFVCVLILCLSPLLLTVHLIITLTHGTPNNCN